VGIATFEDCVEEIVGEIYDENDTPDEKESTSDYITQVSPDVFEVDYRSTVDELGDAIGVEIPSSALYDTVGGFTCDCFDHIPGVGESILVHLPSQTGYDDDMEVGLYKFNPVYIHARSSAWSLQPLATVPTTIK
jgi:CBS domain containing-hemolysin-like protein